MADQATEPVQFPDGVTRCVFDNEQVIGKTHRVKAGNKVPMSIVTSHAYISIDPDSDFQKDEIYSPRAWLFDKPDTEQRHNFLSIDASSALYFRQTRNSFIKERLASVQNEQKENGKDFIDEIIENEEKSKCEKTCADCGEKGDAKGMKCKYCKGSLIYVESVLPSLNVSKEKIDPYIHFTEIETKENNYEVKTGEPDMCNPNSFENISPRSSSIWA